MKTIKKINQYLCLLPFILFNLNNAFAQTPLITTDILLNPTILPNNSFTALDGTRFKNASKYLGNKVTVVYENQILGSLKNYGIAPNENQVKNRLLKYYDNDRIILDIESWTIIQKHKLDPRAREHAEWYLQVLRWAHEVLPNTNIGYYGLPTSPWFAIKKPSTFLDEHKEMLNIIQPILLESDTLYPSFYVFYNDWPYLSKMMASQINIARTLNKPVYPFLWHRGPGTIFNQQVLPINLIAQQCDFVRKYADGLVWWSISWERFENTYWYDAAKECFR